MFDDIGDIKAFIENEVDQFIARSKYLSGIVYFGDISSLNIKSNIQRVEVDTSNFLKKFGDYRDFIDSWNDKIENQLEQEYKENFKDDFDSFDDFVNSEAGYNVSQEAAEDLQLQLENDPHLSEITEFLSDRNIEIDERNLKNKLARIENEIETEVKQLKDFLDKLKFDIFEEIFR